VCPTDRRAKLWLREVTLEDGRTIDPENVLGPPTKRKKLVVVGDTKTTEGLSQHVGAADVLVIEATFLDRIVI
jgi:ribonuclease Z